MALTITRHAERRMNQRGVRKSALSLLLDEADIELPVGGGSTLYRVRRSTARKLGLDDRLTRYGAIVSSDGAVVTVLPVHAGKSGRRYRASN